MTICGALANEDGALVWADTEFFFPGERTQHRSKLTINAVAGVVATGCGMWDLHLEAQRVVREADCLDAMPEAVADALRRSAFIVAKRHKVDFTRSYAGSGFLLAGWSNSLRRFIVWSFPACDFFEPTIGLEKCWPHVNLEARARLRPNLPALAARQMEALRRDLPEAEGGTLTWASINLSGVQLGRLPMQAVPVHPPDLPQAPITHLAMETEHASH